MYHKNLYKLLCLFLSLMIILQSYVPVVALSQTKLNIETFSLGLNHKNMVLQYKDSFNLFLISTPEDAVELPDWISTDTSILEISNANSGSCKVTAVGTGQAEIVVTIGNYSTSCLVVVSAVEIVLDTSELKSKDKVYDGNNNSQVFGELKLVNPDITFSKIGNLTATFISPEANPLLPTEIQVSAEGYELSDPSFVMPANPIAILSGYFINYATAIIQVEEQKFEYTGNQVSLDFIKVTGIDDEVLTGDLKVQCFIGDTPAIPKNVGEYSVSISFKPDASHTNYSQNIITAQSKISIVKKLLTVEGVSIADKIYDGTTTAEIVGKPIIKQDSNIQISGIIKAHFLDDTAAKGKKVVITGMEISGDDSGNYDITIPSITGNILPKEIIVSNIRANNKTYDGNNNAQIDTSKARAEGVLAKDNVNINKVIGKFESIYPGDDIKIQTDGIFLVGEGAENYLITSWDEITASITKAPLSIVGIQDIEKIYDGTPNVLISNLSLEGSVMGDDVFINDDTIATSFGKNVGTYRFTVSNISLGGNNKDCYTIPENINGNITIKPKPLLLENVTVQPKIYDLTTTANIKNGFLVGVIDGENVSLRTVGIRAYFDNPNAGKSKPVTLFLDDALMGKDSANYIIEKNIVVSGDIEKAVPQIILHPFSYTFDNTVKRLTYETIGVSNEKNLSGDVTVIYKIKEQELLPLNCGEYTVVAHYSGNENYLAAQSETAILNIYPSNITGVTFESKSYFYDGTEKEIIVSGDIPKNATISYTSNKGKSPDKYLASAIITADNHNTRILNSVLEIKRDTPKLELKLSSDFARVDDIIEITATIVNSTTNVYEENLPTDIMIQSNLDKVIKLTGNNGIYKGNFTVPNNKDSMELHAVANPNISQSKFYNPVVSNIAKLKITDKVPTTLEINIPDNIVYGDKIDIDISVISVNSSLTADGKVEFLLDGKYLSQSQLDKDAKTNIQISSKDLQHEITVLYAGNNVFEQVKITKSIKLSQRPIEIIPVAKNKTYDGTKAILLDAKVTSLIENDQINVVLSGEFEDFNAGTNKKIIISNVELMGADSKKYLINKIENCTGDILKARSQITIQPASYIYDATEKSLDYKIIGILDEKDMQGTVKTIYTLDGKETTPINCGNYNTIAYYQGNNNYLSSQSSPETLKITPLNITGITYEDKSYIYDGIQKELLISGIVLENMTITYKDNTGTVPDKYSACAVIKADNYNTLTLNSVLEIKKDTPKLEIGLSSNFARVGDVVEITAKIVNSVTNNYQQNLPDNIIIESSLNEIIRLTGKGGIYKGIFTVPNTNKNIEFHASANPNISQSEFYNPVVSDTVVLKITDKIPTNLEVSISDKLVYGDEIEVGVTVTSLDSSPDGKVRFLIDGKYFAETKLDSNSKTTAKVISENLSHEITVAYIANNTFEGAEKTQTIVLSPKEIGISPIANNKTYDKTKMVSIDAQSLGVVKDDKISVIISGEFESPDAGIGKKVLIKEVKILGADSQKYAIGKIDSCVADITKAKSQITLESASHMYDGSKKDLNYKVIGVSGEKDMSGNVKIVYTLDGKETIPIDCGNYQAVAHYDGNNNYLSSKSSPETLTITPNDIGGILFQDRSYVYDGTEKEIVVSGIISENTTITYTNSKGTIPDKYLASATVLMDNFSPITLNAVLEIQKDTPNLELKLDKYSAEVGDKIEITAIITNSITKNYENMLPTNITVETNFNNIIKLNGINGVYKGSFLVSSAKQDITFFASGYPNIQQSKFYNSALSKEAKLKVTNKAPTLIDIDIRENLKYGDDETINISVNSTDKSLMPTGKIKLYLDEKLISEVTLDERAKASVKISPKVSSLKITAEYMGDDNFEISNFSKNITVSPRNLNLVITAKDKIYDDTDKAQTKVEILNMVDGDDLSVLVIAKFANKNSGDNISVSIDSVELSGSSKDNYTFTYNKSSFATIKPIDVKINLDSKTIRYNGLYQELSATTIPDDISLEYTYKLNGNIVSPPVMRSGIYEIVAQTKDKNYSGTKTATLTIVPSFSFTPNSNPPASPTEPHAVVDVDSDFIDNKTEKIIMLNPNSSPKLKMIIAEPSEKDFVDLQQHSLVVDSSVATMLVDISLNLTVKLDNDYVTYDVSSTKDIDIFVPYPEHISPTDFDFTIMYLKDNKPKFIKPIKEISWLKFSTKSFYPISIICFPKDSWKEPDDNTKPPISGGGNNSNSSSNNSSSVFWNNVAYAIDLLYGHGELTVNITHSETMPAWILERMRGKNIMLKLIKNNRTSTINGNNLIAYDPLIVYYNIGYLMDIYALPKPEPVQSNPIELIKPTPIPSKPKDVMTENENSFDTNFNQNNVVPNVLEPQQNPNPQQPPIIVTQQSNQFPQYITIFIGIAIGLMIAILLLLMFLIGVVIYRKKPPTDKLL